MLGEDLKLLLFIGNFSKEIFSEWHPGNAWLQLEVVSRYCLSTWKPLSSGKLSTLIFLPVPSTHAIDKSISTSPISQASRKNAKQEVNFSFFFFFILLHISLFLFLPLLYHVIIFITSFSYLNWKANMHEGMP